jgi:uncharacterized coiled-coil DUF342 family protein
LYNKKIAPFGVFMLTTQNLRLKFIEDVRKMRDTLINTVSEIDSLNDEANSAEMQSLASLRAEITSLEESIRTHQARILATNINKLYVLG